MIKITKATSIDDIKVIFEGEIPDYHPVNYIQSRINDGMVYIAKLEGNIAGFLIYNVIWGNAPMIELIKILPKYQRQGIGSKILEITKKDLKEKGFKKLLSSTEVVNPLGLSFHEKEKFVELNDLSMWHGEEKFYSIDL